MNAPGMAGMTPLEWASRMGRLQMARFLLERGADVNAATEDGSTALHRAVFWGHEAIVDFLLTNGADVEARYGPEDHSAKAEKISPEQRQLFGRLAREGLDSRNRLLRTFSEDGLSDAGETPLLIAAKKGRPRILKALLENGASPNVQDAKGRTALMWAVYKQRSPDRLLDPPPQVYAAVERMLREAGATERVPNE